MNFSEVPIFFIHLSIWMENKDENKNSPVTEKMKTKCKKRVIKNMESTSPMNDCQSFFS